MLTNTQRLLVQYAASISSGLSILGSLYIISRHVMYRWNRRKDMMTSTILSSHQRLDMTKQLIYALSILDLIGAMGRVFGQEAMSSWGESACIIQAYVIEFGDIAPILWNLVMVYNLYCWVCLGMSHDALRKRFPYYLSGTILFSIILCTAALIADVYGEATLWCWVISDEWRYICLYGWVIIAAIIMSYLLYRVQSDVQSRLLMLRSVDTGDVHHHYYSSYRDHGYCNSDDDGGGAASKTIARKLFLYVASFLVLWAPGLLDRTVSVLYREIFILSLLHAWFVPLQGFVNALIYGGLHSWLRLRLQKLCCRKQVVIGTKADVSKDLGRRSSSTTGKNLDGLGIARVFTCTIHHYNNSTAVVVDQDVLKECTTGDYDLFVFSLQNCPDVDALASSILAHLNDSFFPTSFTTFSCHHAKKNTVLPLSVIVFAPTAHVKFGNIVKLGSSCRTENLNSSNSSSSRSSFSTDRLSISATTLCSCVGMAIQYFDVALCFVSVRVESALGTSTVSKNAVIQMIKHLRISIDDDSRIDFTHLYHHTIVLGNFNTDITEDLSLRQKKIVNAQHAKQARMDLDAEIESLLTRRNYYRNSDASSESYYYCDSDLSRDEISFESRNIESPCENQLELQKKWSQMISVVEHEKRCWKEVVSLDTLTRLMESQELLGTFSEASEISFLPSMTSSSSSNYTSDRILIHSLECARNLNVKNYWSSRINRNTVCASLTLEIDRLIRHQRRRRSSSSVTELFKSTQTVVYLSNLEVQYYGRLEAVKKRQSTDKTSEVSPPVSENRPSCDRVSLVSAMAAEIQSMITVFPLPSEDMHGMQRRLQEVAASVNNEFPDTKERHDVELRRGSETSSSISFQNTKSVQWKVARASGIFHSASCIGTTAGNGTEGGFLHMAISLLDRKGNALCAVVPIQSSDSSQYPFDIELSTGTVPVGRLSGIVQITSSTL